MRSRWVVTVSLATIAWAAPAGAQSTYVSASLTGDVVRFTHSETDGTRGQQDGGEALGFALRVGTSIGSTWGVEAEFARPSPINGESSPYIVPLANSGLPYDVLSQIVTGPAGTAVSNLALIYPPISSEIRTSQRNTTFSTSVWARQEISRRVALVYLGGVGFHRTERNMEYTYGPIRGLPGIPIFLPPRTRTRTVAYAARPLVGIDARIGMTDHLELVAGTRLHGLEGGVLVRPSIGLGWTF